MFYCCFNSLRRGGVIIGMMDISSRLVKRCRKFIEPYRVTDGRGFKLSRYDPGDLGKQERGRG